MPVRASPLSRARMRCVGARVVAHACFFLPGQKGLWHGVAVAGSCEVAAGHVGSHVPWRPCNKRRAAEPEVRSRCLCEAGCGKDV